MYNLYTFDLVELFDYIIVRGTLMSLYTLLTNRFIAVFFVTRAIAYQIYVGSQVILYENLIEHINCFMQFVRIMNFKNNS
jgi:hypothetical protein